MRAANRADTTSRMWDDAFALLMQTGPSLRFQPIIDLSRGLAVGYETLARFEGPVSATPDVWFHAAAARGLDLKLEAMVWQQALKALTRLPPNTFLSINASPDFLVSRECEACLEGLPSMQRLVIEITEHVAIDDYDRIESHMKRYRAAGAALAVDDAGAGYASMSHILSLRPQFVKLDRAFIDGCDKDTAKAALIEMVGRFASDLDAWLLAEGIERREELETLVRLGVPLAQGYLLGVPAEDWTEAPPELQELIRELATHVRRRGDIRAVITSAPSLRSSRAAAGPANGNVAVVVDTHSRPRQMVRWVEGVERRSKPMLVKASSGPDVLLSRALKRPEAERFEPLVCIADDGSYVGVVPIEALVQLLLNERRAA